MFATQLLRHKGLARHVVHAFGGDSFARSVPEPLPLKATFAALGSAPSVTRVIGDSINDTQATRALGCEVLLFGHGDNRGHPIGDIGADAIVDRLDAIRC